MPAAFLSSEPGGDLSATAHHSTSQLPTATSVLGSFREGSNLLTIIDSSDSAEPGLAFLMEAKKESYFETVLSGWAPTIYRRSERIDLVTGSGVRGQTYLYWQGDRLLELPVSYWTEGHRWINSPGYVDGTADFTRPVTAACLECHTTYIRALSSDPRANRFDRDSLVPGISCESCHGAGANHVQQESGLAKGAKKKSDYGILNPANFSRDRQVDLCAECHNGIQREAVAPAFSYIPGQPLQNYFKPLPASIADHPDVHGNQVGLLQRSKCYLSSPQMSCSTCHNVHEAEKTAASYSARCLSCHRWQECGKAAEAGHRIVDNCIDCHMPVEPTNVIASQTAGMEVRGKMRNHWIKVYPAASSPEIRTTSSRP